MAYVSNIAVSKTAPNAIRGWFATLSQRFADNRLYARTLRELESLGDRELADLGLSRSSLRDVAYQAVYSK
ncbi:DUF1127 domain-containing protein [Abyssibius alkaniclasticus]|uniref:DUF1127 domain-containing protein n=1 Tax=Abyssibius alkaniclasticus TaxID=2881234 RepID=UPI0023637719|nr:DUF1127 domain-containing protein [Abyssibius alkaniclasticus]UPH70385.1 DUF1127 domain-containing protein [Abyssibius alkaniclasticus]|tara:strand:- start:705 stop:917 length:213 start_codon:yes stop_codon:yes gene_type:complete